MSSIVIILRKNRLLLVLNSRACYRVTPGEKRASSRQHYSANTDKKTGARQHYIANPEKKRACSRQHYIANPEKKRTYSSQQHSANPARKKPAARAYLALNHDNMCAQKRAKYVLAVPKPDVKDMYVKEIQSQLLADAEARSQLSGSFPSQKCIKMPKTTFLEQPCVE